MVNILQGDCMNLMRSKPDKFYDLAIVDPPYGIGADIKNSKKELKSKKSSSISSDYGGQIWDEKIPTKQYFTELKRVSKKQIIWGANYFGLIGGMLYWHKNVSMPTYSTGEIAWLSWLQKVDFVNITWHGMLQQNMKDKESRIHPTQKPVALYKWILNNYAKPGQTVLDTHGGSMSSAIACYDLGFDLDIIELDQDYYKAGKNRFETHRIKCEEIKSLGYAKTELNKINPILF
jgi:site-specific DNA-methyltransferase (adenine-specific)